MYCEYRIHSNGSEVEQLLLAVDEGIILLGYYHTMYYA